MGFFSSIKKKSALVPAPSAGAAAGTPSSSPQCTPRAHASPRLPAVPAFVIEPVRPMLHLRVALHTASATRDADELFWIEVDPEEGVDAVRRAICSRIGNVALGIFKVAIPSDAFEQAAEYAQRYKTSIDLISHFPSYALDDPQQIRHSLGPAGWQVQLPATLRIKDWWPSPLANTDIISIIARPSRIASTSTTRPLTLMAHFALPSEASGSTGSSSPCLSFSRSQRRLPTPVDILPSASIGDLKAALLAADDRAVDKLDKVVLWRVEMSEEEMVVIEQRGGLKSGQMPWPYPPTAQVPTALTNDALPVSHYFSDYHSNTSLVSLSVWIHPSAQHTLARISPVGSLEAPAFRYPMQFPASDLRRASTSHSLPATSPPLDAEVTVRAETLPARVSGRARRARPSTAPAACDSVAPAAFGSGLRSIRARSPLAKAPTHDAQMKGLGIAGSELPPISAQGRQAVESLGEDMTHLNLKVDVGDSTTILLNTPEMDGTAKIVWQPAVGTLRRADTQSRGIRSLANNRSLRAYEIC